ncbi:MAG: ATP-binding cassette domain-containing protein [Crocinitomicaceae bacterium]|nr:ATP-binding cassette domain-containing protein [Crocinitomicaceae bacterium]MBK8924957.1 ATP-binding cassette domain-containing protein [Crocinitomicaceae bacterium]
MIQVEGLCKEFTLTKKQMRENGTSDTVYRAVNDVSFACSPGRIYSLLGPNGAGKTTTLRMISTMILPTRGSIIICGVDALRNPNEARKKIGFLTGSTGLYERLTPDELLKYFADLNDVSKSDFEKRRQHYYDLLNMHDFKSKRIGQLSTGMKQKVSITRTMIHDPEVVVFDEPTSGLDVITAENIITLIRNCKEQNKTVIFSSHIMSEVDLLCDDLAIITKGKLVYNSTMAEFRAQMKSESLTAEFISKVHEA